MRSSLNFPENMSHNHFSRYAKMSHFVFVLKIFVLFNIWKCWNFAYNCLLYQYFIKFCIHFGYEDYGVVFLKELN